MSFNQGELLPSVDTEFKFIPVNWDPDLGTTPEDVKVNEVIYTKFAQDDIGVYTDVPLSGLYDKTRPLHVDIIYETETGGAGNIHWILDYMVTEHGTSATGAFTTNRIVSARTAGNKLEKVTHLGAIPAQNLTGSSGSLTLRFGRLAGPLDTGNADTLNDSVLVLSVQIYQGEG